MVTYVNNLNRHQERNCTAADGETTQVGPGAKNVPIEDRFTWKMHPDVVRARSSVRTFENADTEQPKEPVKEPPKEPVKSPSAEGKTATAN